MSASPARPKYMVIYLDVLFAVNVVMDFATLAAAAHLAGITINRLRLLSAALVGGGYTLFAALFPFLAYLPIRLLSGVGVCAIAFLGRGLFPRLCALYFLVTAAFAGLAATLSAVSGRRLLLGAGYYMTIPFRTLLLVLAVSYAVSGIVLRGDALHGMLRREVETLQISFQTQHMEVRVLHDTGNTLTEPLSGRPAIVLDTACAARLLGVQRTVLQGLTANNAAEKLASLPVELAHSFGLLPYHAVGTACGLLLYFRPDSVRRADGTALNCILAISPEPLGQGRYDGLIGV